MCGVLIVTTLLCMASGPIQDANEHRQSDQGGRMDLDTVTCELKGFNVSDKFIEAGYEIENRSGKDIWICEDIDITGPSFETQFVAGSRTLLIRRRTDVPTAVFWQSPPIGRYTRLRTGKTKVECLLLRLPLHLEGVFLVGPVVKPSEAIERIVIEVGYYGENLPEMVLPVLAGASASRANHGDGSSARLKRGRELAYFNEINEALRNRAEEILVPYTWQGLSGENTLRVATEGIHIPGPSSVDYLPSPLPDLDELTRLVIQYQPSMLEYFFPYDDEQSLLAPSEREYLRTQKTVSIAGADSVLSIRHEISAKAVECGFRSNGSSARIDCYQGDKLLTHLNVYNNTDIETDQRQRFRCRSGLQTLRDNTSVLRPFDVRMQCGANLKDLWYRLRLYHRIRHLQLDGTAGERVSNYPTSITWCDEMVTLYGSVWHREDRFTRAFKCPSIDEGRCHYAMNPDCEYDSPGDMVLLFETEQGWNQHGGPELFTFENHDPRGGLVLLNDGTVKFIRTEEELKQFRWK